MKNESFCLEHYTTIPKDYEEVLYRGISERAFQAKKLSPIRPFGIFIKDQKGQVLGGASGALFYGSVHVDSLWIDENLRNQGWGKRLMHEAEKRGREHGATFATVNTMDWEALLFYQKLGYVIDFSRKGYENQSMMFMLTKTL